MLQENFDRLVQLLSSSHANSPRANMLHSQNNFSNKNNSFIPQINSDLATPAAFDPDLNSSMHFSHSNSKTELFNKSSLVDFTIDEILNEPGNESERHNCSMLLVPPTDKQDIYPSFPNTPFTSCSLIGHENQ